MEVPLPGPNTPKRTIQLDFVRGIAILAVMEYHFLTVPVSNPVAVTFETFFKRVGFGVDLFFVLSGFLVGGLLVQELLKTGSVRIRRFLARRAFKIWPAYYVYILVQVFGHHHPIKTFLWQNLLNVQNYAGTSLSHTWSLAVEEHFYLLLPPLLVFLYKRQRAGLMQILLGICALVLIGRTVSVVVFHSGDTQWPTHDRIDSLLFGVILSFLLYTREELFHRVLTWRIPLLLVALGGLTFIFFNGHHTPRMWTYGYTLNYLAMASILLLVYGYRGRLINSVPYRAVATIGVYSYGIYLWHLSVREPALKLAMHVPVGARWLTLLLLQFAAAILVGVVMTKVIEFPMLRLRDRLVPRGPAHLAPPPEENPDALIHEAIDDQLHRSPLPLS